MNITKALMQWAEQEPEQLSVSTPVMNELVCELLPEALLGSPAQSSCSSHQAAAD